MFQTERKVKIALDISYNKRQIVYVRLKRKLLCFTHNALAVRLGFGAVTMIIEKLLHNHANVNAIGHFRILGFELELACNGG